MSYPEKDAGHKYEPKWLDACRREEGGHVGTDDALRTKHLDEQKQGMAPPASVSYPDKITTKEGA